MRSNKASTLQTGKPYVPCSLRKKPSEGATIKAARPTLKAAALRSCSAPRSHRRRDNGPERGLARAGECMDKPCSLGASRLERYPYAIGSCVSRSRPHCSQHGRSLDIASERGLGDEGAGAVFGPQETAE